MTVKPTRPVALASSVALIFPLLINQAQTLCWLSSTPTYDEVIMGSMLNGARAPWTSKPLFVQQVRSRKNIIVNGGLTVFMDCLVCLRLVSRIRKERALKDELDARITY